MSDKVLKPLKKRFVKLTTETQANNFDVPVQKPLNDLHDVKYITLSLKLIKILFYLL